MYKKHVFVCENMRDDPHKKSCGEVGESIRIRLKKEIVKNKLNHEIRINRSGCLGKCAQGPCLVSYPEGKWHFNIVVDESDRIIEELISE